MIRLIQRPLLAILLGVLAVEVTNAQSAIVGWGTQVFDSRFNEQAFVEIAAGGSHTLALRGDGSVIAWGNNWDGQCIVPTLPAGLSYVEIAAAGNSSGDGSHTVARRSDG